MGDRPLQKLRRTFTRAKDVKTQQPEVKRVGTLSVPVKVKREAWSDDKSLPSHPQARASFDRLQYLRSELSRFRAKKQELEDRENVLVCRMAFADLAATEHKEDAEAWAPDAELDAMDEAAENSTNGAALPQLPEDSQADQADQAAATATEPSNNDKSGGGGDNDAPSTVLDMLTSDGVAGSEQQRSDRAMSLDSSIKPAAVGNMRNHHSLSVRWHRRQTTRRRREVHASAMPTRTLFLVRTEPGMPLGADLTTLLVPQRNTRGRIPQPAVPKTATFVSAVEDNSVADKAGVRVGDEVLEVDGAKCTECGVADVLKHINANEGTITLVVRFSSDYKRLVLHKKKVQAQAALREQQQRLQRLRMREADLVEALRQRQKEKAVLDVVSSWQQAPSASSSEDDLMDREDSKLWLRQCVGDGVHLSEADVLSHCKTSNDLKQAILDLQQAWQAERLMFQGSRLILERRLQRVTNGLSTLHDLEAGAPAVPSSRSSSAAGSRKHSQQPAAFGVDLQKQEVMTTPRPRLVLDTGLSSSSVVDDVEIDADAMAATAKAPSAATAPATSTSTASNATEKGAHANGSSSHAVLEKIVDMTTPHEPAASTPGGANGSRPAMASTSSAATATSMVSSDSSKHDDDAFMFEPAPAPPSEDDDSHSDFISEIHHSEV
ncbi:hypothetical protein PTSG_12175 [Salpingoeca rosetta]|uniref:PDZ domain-containing protein n=1 Tax=Salpingoeca rosetta (strain ATCC 50818 / BSB-021) TaxID=946362 RepID=F2U8K2_SALR5|nr:uncharacterized protein PTSG_12175 [Salpingoeca rosetta]EGD72710.1 hypothetical protein PTSG_12175 [Salpingoeca rosetta]|eukprot:XP_004994533.1 hypothetical protein PTSG_12175 [Salpingoeca rosetta]